MSMMKSAKTAIGKKVMAAEINAAPEALEISRKHCSTPCERKYRERALEIVPYGGAKRRGATQDGLKAKMETQNVTTLWLCDFWLNLRVSNGRWDANERSTVQKGRSRINGSACVERIQFYYVTFFPHRAYNARNARNVLRVVKIVKVLRQSASKVAKFPWHRWWWAQSAPNQRNRMCSRWLWACGYVCWVHATTPACKRLMALRRT